MIIKQARVLLALAFLCGAVAVLSACNTVEGFGRDMQRTGEAIQNI